MNCNDFEIKKEFEVESLVLSMILTPKYIIMHDEENVLNWVTAYEEPYYTKMEREKTYQLQGGGVLK